MKSIVYPRLVHADTMRERQAMKFWLPQRPMARWTVSVMVMAFAPTAQAIVGGLDTTGFRAVDTGVQISANWVLTARHVAGSVGSTYSNGWGSSTVAARFAPGDANFPVDDLWLLRLATPIATASPLLLNDVVLEPGSRSPALPVTLTTGSNQTPRGYAFSELREVFDSVDPDGDGPEPIAPVDWLVTYTAGMLPYVEGGDSGGGLFLGHVTDSSSALLGITSAQLSDTNAEQQPCCFASAFVQVASYRSWIDGVMTADLTDTQLANWVSAVPEPHSAELLAAGVLLAGAWRIRRFCRKVFV